MLRTTRKINPLYQRRTLRSVVRSSVYPYGGMVDLKKLGTTIVYPGMVASRNDDGKFVICNGETEPVGLFNNFIGGVMDELGGNPEVGVWLLNSGSVFIFELLRSDAGLPLDPYTRWDKVEKFDPIYVTQTGGLTITPNGWKIGHIIADEPVSASKAVIQFDLPIPNSPYEAGWLSFGYHDLTHPDYLMGVADRAYNT